MSRPASITDFGTLLPPAPPATRTRKAGRFADVVSYAAQAMPTVKVGQVYADLDPRCRGRHIQVLKVTGDGKVMVRTIQPATSEPRTAATTRRDTTGDISFISLRRFRENSRGFRYVRGTALRSVQSYFLASRLAAACGIPMTEMERRAADALIAILGNFDAHAYMDELCRFDGEGAHDIYSEGGISYLLNDALLFAKESGRFDEWPTTEHASKATARLVSSHT